jgi:UDP:flavonoid glycosyltransferase YjiC (YdhE family)
VAKRFLFCPLASQGYVYPMVGIALALRGLGHDVAFVTGPGFEEILRAAGIKRIRRGDHDGPSFETELWWEPLAVAIQVKHIEHALALFEPDVLVGHQLTRGPLIVAERRSLPVAVLGFSTYLWPYGRLVSRSAQSDRDSRLVWRFGDMLDSYNKARDLFSLPPDPGEYATTGMLGDLFMLQGVPEFEPDTDRLPARVHLVGACVWEPPHADDDLARWLNSSGSSGDPLLYVQHGRLFHLPSFWPPLVHSLEHQPIRVAADIGRMDGDVGRVPETWFVRDHLPQGTVLPEATAVISAANTASVLGAMLHGVPSLLIPGGGEQPDVAERCVALGTSVSLAPDEVNDVALTQAIADLLHNNRLRARAKTMQACFARWPGCERSAALLACLASTQSPVLRS